MRYRKLQPGVAALNPFALSSSLAQMWIDSSVQTVRSAAEFWNGIVAAGTDASTSGTMPRTSTAAPWWKAPEPSRTALPALDPFAWASMWTPAAAPKSTSPDLTQFWATAWAPWMPRSTPPASSTFNPMELWQQAWLQSMPQLAALTASFARPSSFGAPWSAVWPATPAAATTAVPAAWQPVMSVYRTANGHAMAAVLRTMADVVEPKSRKPDIMDFWPNPLGTRH